MWLQLGEFSVAHFHRIFCVYSMNNWLWYWHSSCSWLLWPSIVEWSIHWITGGKYCITWSWCPWWWWWHWLYNKSEDNCINGSDSYIIMMATTWMLTSMMKGTTMNKGKRSSNVLDISCLTPFQTRLALRIWTHSLLWLCLICLCLKWISTIAQTTTCSNFTTP